MVICKISIVHLIFGSLLGVSAVVPCANNSMSTGEKLQYNLLCGYNKDIRPVKNSSSSIVVDVYLAFRDLYVVTDDVMSIHAWLTVFYENEFLTWDPKKYNGQTKISIPANLIWTPKIVLLNSKFTDSHLASRYTTATVTNRGEVSVFLDTQLTVHCAMNLLRWPHDSHVCHLAFFSEYATGNQTLLRLHKNSSVDMRHFNKNKAWDLGQVTFEVKALAKDPSGDSTAQFLLCTFRMTRHSSILASTTTVPIAVAVILIFVSFWLKPMDGFRYVLLLTSFIVHVLYLQILGKSLPANGGSDVHIISYLRNSVAMCGLAMLLLTISRTMMQLKDTPPWLMRTYNMVKSKNSMHFLLLPQENEAENDESGLITATNRKPNQDWVLLTTLFDRICFILYFLFYFISVMIIIF
ncbi:5-hydroxytryptamine receptor 3A-like isoform X2 [Cimex lectularius]|uniref:Neurotransmitter-gated ion-channel ligand-binding domain-containing protein n=1 Tax=Cimex lectularius TaxID=79782 RepID=A0A8I6RGX7_CIMLE|nr:5-hydroxytryptamine receptor 3A-like isoform X2 [Cimex lectularius]